MSEQQQRTVWVAASHVGDDLQMRVASTRDAALHAAVDTISTTSCARFAEHATHWPGMSADRFAMDPELVLTYWAGPRQPDPRPGQQVWGDGNDFVTLTAQNLEGP